MPSEPHPGPGLPGDPGPGGRAAEVGDAVLAARARLGAVRLVAVDGPSGAGTSTFAAELLAYLRAEGVRASLLSTDDFATWDDPVAWWPRLVTGVLDPLAAGVPGRYRRTEWSGGEPRPGALVDVAVPDVLVVEGVSAGRASVRSRLSRLCWVPGPAAPTRLERSVTRDGEWARPYLRAWQRFERGWFAVDAPERSAQDIIPPTLDPVPGPSSDPAGD